MVNKCYLIILNLKVTCNVVIHVNYSESVVLGGLVQVNLILQWWGKPGAEHAVVLVGSHTLGWAPLIGHEQPGENDFLRRGNKLI